MKFSSPCDFGIALMTFMPEKAAGSNTWIIGPRTRITLQSEGGPLTFVKDDNLTTFGKKGAVRLGFNFGKRIAEGKIRVVVDKVKK